MTMHMPVGFEFFAFPKTNVVDPATNVRTWHYLASAADLSLIPLINGFPTLAKGGAVELDVPEQFFGESAG